MEELIGHKFNNLTIISNTTIIGKKYYVDAICDCGKSNRFRLDSLKNGHTKSCGCLSIKNAKELAKKYLITHNLSNTSEYKIFNDIKKRCYNKNYKDYFNYGGRGIKVCDKWLESFENFYSDMGERPSPKHSIDRIDVNGDYCKENCRWATSKQQNLNKRNTLKVIINGKEVILKEYCNSMNISYSLIRDRLKRGMDINECFDKKIKYNLKKAIINGKEIIISDECKKRGINAKIVIQRIVRNKWDVEKALNMPIINKKNKK